MCLVPARNGDRIARDDRDGRKALAEHIPRNDYSEPKITYLKDTGKGLDRSAMTHGNSVRKSLENIEDQEVINKILLHLGLWRPHQRPPPKPKSLEIQIDYSDSQLPFYEEAFDQDFGVSIDPSTV
jgi:hypothetical protein